MSCVGVDKVDSPLSHFTMVESGGTSQGILLPIVDNVDVP